MVLYILQKEALAGAESMSIASTAITASFTIIFDTEIIMIFIWYIILANKCIIGTYLYSIIFCKIETRQ